MNFERITRPPSLKRQTGLAQALRQTLITGDALRLPDRQRHNLYASFTPNSPYRVVIRSIPDDPGYFAVWLERREAPPTTSKEPTTP